MLEENRETSVFQFLEILTKTRAKIGGDGCSSHLYEEHMAKKVKISFFFSALKAYNLTVAAKYELCSK